MYNVDFLPQLEASRRHLFGSSGIPPDKLEAAMILLEMKPFKTVPCHQDTNGEWVPDQVPEDQTAG